jgi:hypothetical protein
MRIILLIIVCLGIINSKAQDYEWNVDNTSSSPGERIVAILEAASIGNYTGVEIYGQVVDNNGNWGYALPTIAEFSLFVRYSGGISYDLVQSQKTKNIILGLRKISDSKVHLVANCPFSHQGGRVLFKKIEGGASVTLGNPSINAVSGDLLISEPKYYTSLNGMVGIGGVRPDSHVSLGNWNSGNSGVNGGVQLQLSGLHNNGSNMGGKKLLIEGYDNDGSTTYPIYCKDENSNIDFWIRNRPHASSLPIMYFAGRVGVGTTSPLADLDVKGIIKATEIKVEAQTADFVFEDNYHLKDLTEVEAFILTNKHLPEIPSATEMEEAGVNLAEMNKLLLMKVEELTLYAIKQNEEKNKLEEEVFSIKQELEAIKDMIMNNNLK